MCIRDSFSDIFTVSKEPEDEDIIWADVLKVADEAAAVSYTHLDVYKRQEE